ncbi:alpha/beta fold hydrolase [Luteimicrobium subarcticum]|uniref:Alpha/beta hydrolase family protein n=1 Tax=Luteimicrobium subarcticum TaxID=620910 RepID=A0A2M8WR45_9MICO|nr:alpha/beta hydrolase [Luteimicrobium subarcticum]PJI93374.1 alpha/beta hydrolase family protein [Luteimicrobium subarcticum]
MTTFLLLPGAGGEAEHLLPLARALQAGGHRATAVDLPVDDEAIGWSDLADLAARPLQDQGSDDRSSTAVVVVALSMGAFLAPLVCSRTRVDRIVLVNPMVPAPGESAGQWWADTGHADARAAAGLGPFDAVEDFFHDVPADVRERLVGRPGRSQSERSFAEPWPLDVWPDVPTHVVQGDDDRLFPVAFQRRVTRDRLGVDVHVVPGGHLLPLSRPDALAEVLLGFGSAE